MAIVLPVAQITTPYNSGCWKSYDQHGPYNCSGISGSMLVVLRSCDDFSIQLLRVQRHLCQSCNCLPHGCVLLSGRGGVSLKTVTLCVNSGERKIG